MERDLGESLFGEEQHRALGRSAEPDEKDALLLEAVADQALNRGGGVMVENVDVESRSEFGEDAGVLGRGINAGP